MTTTTYTPQPGSIPDRVISYFRRLPDEELSSKDIGLKYSCDPKNLLNILKAATEAGYLQRDGQIYGAGPNIAALNPGTPPVHNAFGGLVQPPVSTRASPKPVQRALIDTAAIIIEDDVPLLESGSNSRDKWGPLLARLVKPGQSFKLPIEMQGAISAAIGKEHKKGDTRFKRATISATELRVWRAS
jgi:hypothetical protein